MVTTWVDPRNGFVTSEMLGGVAVRERFATGRILGISEMCTDCYGSGIQIDPAHDPDCGQCSGTGQRNAWDSSGDYETENCLCVAPVVGSEAA